MDPPPQDNRSSGRLAREGSCGRLWSRQGFTVSAGWGRGGGNARLEAGRHVLSDSSLLGPNSRSGTVVVVVVVDSLLALSCGCYWQIQMSEFVWGADKHDSASKCWLGVGLTCWPDEVPVRSVLSQPLTGDPRVLLPSVTLLSLSHVLAARIPITMVQILWTDR